MSSLDEKEFKAMVGAIRNTEKALGTISFELTEKVKKNKKFARSIFAVADMVEGEKFTEENIRVIRPGYGLHPKYYNDILGKKAAKLIRKGVPLSIEDLT